MTEQTQQRSTNRPPASTSMAWKSGLLGASLGAVLLGWGLLARDSTKPSSAPTPAQPQIIVVRVPAQGWPDSTSAAAASQDMAQGQPAVIDIAPLPRRPVFQQPVTRTRSS